MDQEVTIVGTLCWQGLVRWKMWKGCCFISEMSQAVYLTLQSSDADLNA